MGFCSLGRNARCTSCGRALLWLPTNGWSLAAMVGGDANLGCSHMGSVSRARSRHGGGVLCRDARAYIVLPHFPNSGAASLGFGDRIRKADVLILGSSHAMFGISAQTIS